jgi:hypothetical protein
LYYKNWSLGRLTVHFSALPLPTSRDPKNAAGEGPRLSS